VRLERPPTVEPRNGGRGLPHETSFFALAGWAHLRMDTRGQGTGWMNGWSTGDTPDLGGDGSPAAGGYLTQGVLDPSQHYYRRVFTDAVRAVDAVRAHEVVRADRVAVTGVSQGGGIAIAVGGLMPDLAAVAPDVPFLCDFRRATTIMANDPYGEIVRYCRANRDHVERVLGTLDYLDGVNHAARGTAPSLWSAALMDDICPPSTVHAAYNAWPAPKEIITYPFNGHEGGGPYQEARKLAFLHDILDS
jgi:cephalosporin-C deacetylase